MKYLLAIASFLIMSIPTSVVAQTIGFIPDKLPAVETKEYDFAVRVLEETYETIRQNNGEFNYINYWNLALAYTMCMQPQDEVAHFISESVRLNPLSFHQLAGKSIAEPTVADWRKYLGEERWLEVTSSNVDLTAMAQDREAERLKKIREYSDLQCLIAAIREDDQRHRTDTDLDLEKQEYLDQKNISLIDSLYAQFGEYVGKKYVGEDLAHVMWLVIQHSDPGTMLRYLPTIQAAASEGELARDPFKMLVDRICTYEHSVKRAVRSTFSRGKNPDAHTVYAKIPTRESTAGARYIL